MSTVVIAGGGGGGGDSPSSSTSSSLCVRKPRNREVCSRYKSPSSSPSLSSVFSPSIGQQSAQQRRFPSPHVTDRGASGAPKRAFSTERRRPFSVPDPKYSDPRAPPGGGSSGLSSRRSSSSVRTELLFPLPADQKGTPAYHKRDAGRNPPPAPPTTPYALPPLDLGENAKPSSDNIRTNPHTPNQHPQFPKSLVSEREKSQTRPHVRPSRPLPRPLSSSSKPLHQLVNETVSLPPPILPPSCSSSLDYSTLTNPPSHSLKQARVAAIPPSILVESENGDCNASDSDSISSGSTPSTTATNQQFHQWPTNSTKSFISEREKAQARPQRTARPLPRPLSSCSSKSLHQLVAETPPPSILPPSSLDYSTPSLGRRTATTEVNKPPSHSLKQAVVVAVPPSQIAESENGDNNASDSDSVSSGSTITTPSTITATTTISNSRVRGFSKAPRGTTVPSRIWHDLGSTRSSVRRLSESTTKLPPSTIDMELSGRGGVRQKVNPSEPQSSSSSPSVTVSSSLFSSPQKTIKNAYPSPSRSLLSPTRSRPPPLQAPPPSSTASSLQNPKLSSVSTTTLNFGKGKQRGLNQTEEANLYRILQNRLLQCHFVNARAEVSMNAQRVAAEKQLCSVWAQTCELRASVTAKKIKLQEARLEQILNSILSGQIPTLKELENLQQEHMGAVSGIVEALEAATLRVPVTAGVRADIRAITEAMGSAVDIINALDSAITFLLPKGERSNASISELAQVAAQERVLLEECGDLLQLTSAFEIEERSLRTHLLQEKQDKASVVGHRPVEALTILF